METILVIYNSPENLGIPKEELETLRECFTVHEYSNASFAFDAYANTICTWSTLLDDSVDVEDFIDEAVEAIERNDIIWLEQNFV